MIILKNDVCKSVRSCVCYFSNEAIKKKKKEKKNEFWKNKKEEEIELSAGTYISIDKHQIYFFKNDNGLSHICFNAWF